MILRDTIIALGDSITFGSRDLIEGRGYPSVLEKLISAKTGKVCICLNKGVPAENSTDTRNRAYDIFRSYPEAQLVTLLTGTNDLKSPPQLDIYEQNISQIVNMARIYNKKIIVACLPPISSMGMWCFPHNAMEGVKKYNEILHKLSEEMRFPLVNFGFTEEHLIDGVHLTPIAYKLMAERWFIAIKDML